MACVDSVQRNILSILKLVRLTAQRVSGEEKRIKKGQKKGAKRVGWVGGQTREKVRGIRGGGGGIGISWFEAKNVLPNQNSYTTLR